MQKSQRNYIFEKPPASHLQRYSQFQLKTQRVDKVLITQMSLYPQTRIKSVKTKLPTLRGFQTTGSLKKNNHSHGKVMRMHQSVNEMKNEFYELSEGFNSIKDDFQRKRQDLVQKLEQTQSKLKVKINRLDQMVSFSITEAHNLSQHLMEECSKLKQNGGLISSKIAEIKEKVRSIQNNMGIYTGEDKYYL